MTPEQEWRSHLLSELKDIKGDVKKIMDEMATIKVKVALFSSIISSVATFIASKLFSNP